MKAMEVEEQIQDEIKKKCIACKREYVVAYWDFELEYYIYLENDPLCVICSEIEAIKESEVA